MRVVERGSIDIVPMARTLGIASTAEIASLRKPNDVSFAQRNAASITAEKCEPLSLCVTDVGGNSCP